MRRLFHLTYLVVLLALVAVVTGSAQPQVYVSGRVAPGDVRVFLKDTVYLIDHQFVIGGTLIIEPGTTVKFQPNSRIIDSVGGRIIADGFASSQYTANPDAINPISTPFSSTNPLGFYGYADLAYFLYQSSTDRTLRVNTVRDLTVHANKYNYVFNVVLDTAQRKLINLQSSQVGQTLGANQVIVSFEQAITFIAARLYNNPTNDVNLNILPWQRLGNKAVDFGQGTITFKGQFINGVSREWGHFLILPGAGAAFFRNVVFDNIRKDTTVDRIAIYNESVPGADWATINRSMNQLTNGSGGAITTMSSRTWLLNCEFRNNTARYRGGALQILQSPAGFPVNVNLASLGTYDINKNPGLTNSDGTPSSVNATHPIPMIDKLDEPGTLEPISDFNRQAFDDGRLSVFLGRMRNLKFTNNIAQLANFGETTIGTPPIKVNQDLLNEPALYPQKNYFNHAYGGAIYIAGRDADETRQMEIGLGINNSIRNSNGLLTFPNEDKFEALNNTAANYQSSPSSFGARGGAIYVGKYSSLIIAGKVDFNQTMTKFLQDQNSGSNSGFYSMGGAIFCENTFGRLQVRGGPKRDVLANATEFVSNKSGSGGAIYVDGNSDPQISPIIGGSDAKVFTRDYGFHIKFENNTATSFGGAIFTRRNTTINGAGGVEAGALIGYGGNYPILFNNNTAGYGGGALNIRIPNSYPTLPAQQRTVDIVRAVFTNNVVGADVTQTNKAMVRGGGAIYSVSGDLNIVKGVEFTANKVYNGNGAAISMVNPVSSLKRFFVTDVDVLTVNSSTGIATDLSSTDAPFVWDSAATYPADARMLTRFLDNEIVVDPDILAAQSGSGTTQVGSGTVRTSAKLLGSFFVNQSLGFVVGFNGTIIKLTNNGNDWAYKNYNTTYRLSSTYFFSASSGVVVGDRGLIIKTDNAGDTWREVRAGLDPQPLNAVTFSNGVGYAVGGNGMILKSTNAGDTWFNPTSSKITGSNLNSVYFRDANNGFAVGDNGTIIVTADGGANWTARATNTFANFKDITFINTSVGYAVGTFGAIFKTTDAGNNWTSIYNDPSKNFNSVTFTDINNGFVAGEYGLIIKTTNAGTSWTQQTSNASFALNNIEFITSSNGFAVGDYGTIVSTTNGGTNWNEVKPVDKSIVDIRRMNPDVTLPENGIGLGGAIYILDSTTLNRVGRIDSVVFNRVRIQNNKAFTGSAIYSDNFDLKLILNRSLVTTNTSYSDIGSNQNVITGPVSKDGNLSTVANFASSDLASAVIYGEVQGPLPSYNSPVAANSIYNNNARFIVRLPDAPNTKGVLMGSTGIGFGGTDTLRGNYWGQTEANVNIVLNARPDSLNLDNPVEETFFVATDGKSWLPFLFQPTTDLRTQGPFESPAIYNYKPIPMANKAGDENTPADNSIPEQLLMSGKIYDLYDKGTDIKTADYSNRRMSPIEDFAVGIPPVVRRYNDAAYSKLPSYGKYVKRWIRDPFAAEALDSAGNYVYPIVHALQDEYRPDGTGAFYHPIGYPVYLEAQVNYEGLAERSNHDPRALNESVFFVINEATGDFIRLNMKQVSEDAPYREIYRGRVDLVPDSTYRNPNTLLRRTAEGLDNPGIGFNLLTLLYHDAAKEDRSTLPGRKYHAATNALGGVPNLFTNRPSMPVNNNDNVTYFAGERYRALPVDTGDVVRIVSRTVLWKEGVVPAYDNGIAFKVTHTTVAPVFTGNIVHMQTDTITKIQPSEYPWKREKGIYDTLKITQFLNKIFVTEDRDYPQAPGTYSDPTLMGDAVGRDSILSVTAYDTNRFFDPRAIDSAFKFTYLTYRWSVAPNSGLNNWLFVDTVMADKDAKDNAHGYLVFRGIPINPYVVPGGEDVQVSAASYPPSARTIDSLKKAGWTPDQINQFVNIFMSYYAEAKYDSANARFLNQDTIGVGAGVTSGYERNYGFKLFVVDSVPRFLPNVATDEAADAATTTLTRRGRNGQTEDYVKYRPQVFTCDLTSDGKLKANLTDKLRFQVDFSTDDECEDNTAAALGWDFRYGKTAYGFMNKAIRNNGSGDRGGDTTVIDSTVYDKDMNGQDNDLVITQTRPFWMSEKYMYTYGNESTTDSLANAFTQRGQLNIRIDAAEATALLTPSNQYAGALNTDTTFTIVVNDGHGGMTYKAMPVFINVAPVITTETLPPAKEDQDYNPQLVDSARMIKVFDPNYGQDHEFELIYSSFGSNTIDKDPCFKEAGSWDVSGLKVTPDWLKINKISGLLYGTPRLQDAPDTAKVTVAVWDMVDGQRQLSAIKTYTLIVDTTNHLPHIIPTNQINCVQGTVNDTIRIVDLDLMRKKGNPEQINLEVIEPSGLTISPASFTGISSDTVVAVVKGDLGAAPANGRVTIKIKVTDASGATEEFDYEVKVSDKTDFVVPITVKNSDGSFQILKFGTAQNNASTGQGDDGNPQGKLDPNFCEFEIPPVPEKDVFDARWYIPTIQGTYVSIYPRAAKAGQYAWLATIQAGGVTGNTSQFYPITISWDKTLVPPVNDNTHNPAGSTWWLRDVLSGQWFAINMATGTGAYFGAQVKVSTQGNIVSVEVPNAIDRFEIVYDFTSDVPAGYSAETTGIQSVSPNPFDNNTTVTFGMQKAGNIKIDVLDNLGHVVKVLANSEYGYGLNAINWDGRDMNGVELPSGTYTCRMVAGNIVSTYQMVIVK